MLSQICIYLFLGLIILIGLATLLNWRQATIQMKLLGLINLVCLALTIYATFISPQETLRWIDTGISLVIFLTALLTGRLSSQFHLSHHLIRGLFLLILLTGIWS